MDPKTLKDLTIAPETSVRDALKAIDRSRRQIALVVDGDFRLLATVTDGDVRRGILSGVDLEGPVSQVMNAHPTTVRKGDSDASVRSLIRARKLQQIPVLDDDGRLADLLTLDDLFGLSPRDTRVVLMAGGLGKRLRPLTETIPKPMLPVGGKPLLEQIIAVFAEQGFHRISISVNYRKEMVIDHFGDGRALGVEIDYIHEDQPMGTAGALSLMPQRPTAPFIVMNGDLLVSLKFANMLKLHSELEAAGTLAVREFDYQVPYGVVRSDGDLMREIVEKPVERYYVNAGIYALSPRALDAVQPGEPLDMPTLLTRLRGEGERIGVFPVSDYWRDIGRLDDLEAARSEFEGVFRP